MTQARPKRASSKHVLYSPTPAARPAGSVAAAPHRRPLRHVGSGRSALSAATSAAASGAGAPHARRYRRADASLGHRSAISDASAGTLMTNTESLGSRYTAANSSVTGGGGRFGGASRSSAGGGAAHGRRRGRAGGGRAAPPKPQPGPVARAVMEWGGRDDWISRALLRHALATAIQVGGVRCGRPPGIGCQWAEGGWVRRGARWAWHVRMDSRWLG